MQHHLKPRTILNDKYLICKSLGEGGFGITYMAWDINLGMKVAIKEYFPNGYVNRNQTTGDVIVGGGKLEPVFKKGLKRFLDEAMMLVKVQSLPGVVNVRDFFSAKNTAYIVMEFLDGKSLKKYLDEKGGKLPYQEVFNLARPIMESLVIVHKTGLVHRDISPDNIIITKGNFVKLIDFGAAKMSNSDGKSLSVILKPGYAPEEQYRRQGQQGPWSDVYALAVTMYRSMTGIIPPESIERVVKDNLIRPTRFGIPLSPSQEAALLKGMAVLAKNRFQDMQKFMDALYNAPAMPFPTVSGKTTTSATKTERSAPTMLEPKPMPEKPKAAAVAPKSPAEEEAEQKGFFNRLFGKKKK